MKIVNAKDVESLAIAFTEDRIHFASYVIVYAIAPHLSNQNLAIPIEVHPNCNSFDSDSSLCKGALNRILIM